MELNSEDFDRIATSTELNILVAGVDKGVLADEDVGKMLSSCRQYLLMIANEVIGPELRAKLGASDLVQDTFLEAHRHISNFRGKTRAEVCAWLRRILECRLANVRRSYLATEKRATFREVAIDPLLAGLHAENQVLKSRALSPSDHAIRNEWNEALEQGLMRLPDRYREPVAWRHKEQLSWDEIGRRLGCTAEAARKVWTRGIQRLRRELAEHGSMP
jgi:RNA polymerase sigma-70 factor, ECF subfamily